MAKRRQLTDAIQRPLNFWRILFCLILVLLLTVTVSIANITPADCQKAQRAKYRQQSKAA